MFWQCLQPRLSWISNLATIPRPSKASKPHQANSSNIFLGYYGNVVSKREAWVPGSLKWFWRFDQIWSQKLLQASNVWSCAGQAFQALQCLLQDVIDHTLWERLAVLGVRHSCRGYLFFFLNLQLHSVISQIKPWPINILQTLCFQPTLLFCCHLLVVMEAAAPALRGCTIFPAPSTSTPLVLLALYSDSLPWLKVSWSRSAWQPVARITISEPFSQGTRGHMLQELLDLGPGMCVAFVTKELGSGS